MSGLWFGVNQVVRDGDVLRAGLRRESNARTETGGEASSGRAQRRLPVLLGAAPMTDQSPPSSQLHRVIAAEQVKIVPFAIVTVSDTRTPETDTNGQYLRERIETLGHPVAGYRIIKDEPDQVTSALDDFAAGDARLILFNGGTGIAPRDTTYDVLSRKLEKELVGFGELFRMLSYEQVGAAAMLSRATAGVYRNKLIFSTPGSNAAVRLAWEKLIEPELHHLAWEVIR
jgi:molybdenum cofactor biosynthesis protein B